MIERVLIWADAVTSPIARAFPPGNRSRQVHRTYAEVCLGCGGSGTIAVLEASVAYALPCIYFRRSAEGVFQRAQSVEGVGSNGDVGLGTFDDFNKSSGLAQCIVLKVNASVRKLPSTIEAHFVRPARDREWTAYVAMPAPKEPVEDGSRSKFHNLLPGNLASILGLPLACARWPSGLRKIPLRSEGSEELPGYGLLGAINPGNLVSTTRRRESAV